MKKFFLSVCLTTIAVATNAENSWPTNASECVTPSWPVAKYPATPKFPKFPVEPGTSWPTEPVC